MIKQEVLTRVTELFMDAGVSGLEPKLALITEDCRDPKKAKGNLNGHLGLYLGDFNFPSLLKLEKPTAPNPYDKAVRVDEEEELFPNGNPLILADTGELIWGIECYWGKVEGSDIKEIKNAAPALGESLDTMTDVFSDPSLLNGLRDKLLKELIKESKKKR